jgi:hypothetical protein
MQAGGAPAHFHLCLDCGEIREDRIRRDGTLTGETYWHDVDSDTLPASVTEQARDILDRPKFTQGSLFGDDQ